MAEREASGDFDYLFEDPADADGVTSYDSAPDPETPDDDMWDDPGDDFWAADPESGDDRGFDAFNASTWNFTPAPIPWYRTKPAMTALVAAAAAMVAIVVSGVLLVFRGPGDAVDETTPVTPTAPSSAAPATLASSAQPPPPPPPRPPPPPPETSASSVDSGPNVGYPSVRPRPTKEPEIGVTRTPATRSPISVAPQPRRPG